MARSLLVFARIRKYRSENFEALIRVCYVSSFTIITLNIFQIVNRMEHIGICSAEKSNKNNFNNMFHFVEF